MSGGGGPVSTYRRIASADFCPVTLIAEAK
jgi:hypothetical protein